MKVAYQWWSTLVFAAVILQVGFAGYGAFYTAHKTDNDGVVNQDTFDHGFTAHGIGALVVIISVLVLLIIGVAAGIGRWRLGRHGVLALLLVLQVILAGAAFSIPVFGFFHAVNALLIVGTAGSIAYSTWREARVPAAAEPSPAEPSPAA